MKIGNYILDKDGNPIIEKDIIKWARWFESHGKKRIVKQKKVGKIKISTVFLGLDHNFTGIGNPILYETMIFGGKLDGETWRYSSKDKATKGHRHAVKMVENL